MEYDLKEILLKIRSEKKVSISFIQRELSFGFNKAYKVFNELIANGYVNSEGVPNKQKICDELGEEYKLGIKIIFLDVDGVLNCRTTEDVFCGSVGIEDEKVSLLKQIVDSTKAVIVLVSSWKEWWYKEPKLKREQDRFANYLD